MVVCNPSHFVSNYWKYKDSKKKQHLVGTNPIFTCLYIYTYVCVCARVNHKISLSFSVHPKSIVNHHGSSKNCHYVGVIYPMFRVGYELISGGGGLESKHHPFISSSPSANPLIPNHCPLDHQLPGREAACHARGTACAAQSPRRGACRRWPPRKLRKPAVEASRKWRMALISPKTLSSPRT